MRSVDVSRIDDVNRVMQLLTGRGRLARRDTAGEKAVVGGIMLPVGWRKGEILGSYQSGSVVLYKAVLYGTLGVEPKSCLAAGSKGACWAKWGGWWKVFVFKLPQLSGGQYYVPCGPYRCSYWYGRGRRRYW